MAKCTGAYISAVLINIYTSGAYAQEVPTTNPPIAQNGTSEASKVTGEKKEDETTGRKGINDFLGHFSVGAAVLIFSDPLIETAETTGVNKKVIVTESRSHSVTPWLQANYVWDAAYDRGYWPIKTVMPGIFAGVGMGPDGSFLDTFGVGAQLSFRRIDPGKSLNLGIGYYFSEKKELAPGIKDGEPLPPDYDQIKYSKRSARGLMVNLSFGFQ